MAAWRLGTAVSASPVAEEAGKLAEALVEWARERGGAIGGQAGGHPGGHVGGHVDGHVGGSAECTLCPVCQLIALGRSASPEIFEHLAAAATSLLAAAGALASQQQAPVPRAPVQHIDLDLG